MPLIIPDSMIRAAIVAGLSQAPSLGYRAGPFVEGSVETPHGTARVLYDASHKYTGQGWGLDVTGEARLPIGLIVGGSYGHQNGGPWSKDVVRGRVGYEHGPLSVVAEKDLWAGEGTGNRGTAVHGRLQTDVPLTREMALRLLVDAVLHRFADTGTTGPMHYGASANIGAGLSWGTR